jgi:hypothetical protein
MPPRLPSLPIVTVNLWFDARDAGAARRPAGRVTSSGIFDRRAIIGGDASHLSLTSSGAEAIVSQTNES